MTTNEEPSSFSASIASLHSQLIAPNRLLTRPNFTQNTSVAQINSRSVPRIVDVDLATGLVQVVGGWEVRTGRCVLHEVSLEEASC